MTAAGRVTMDCILSVLLRFRLVGYDFPQGTNQSIHAFELHGLVQLLSSANASSYAHTTGVVVVLSDKLQVITRWAFNPRAPAGFPGSLRQERPASFKHGMPIHCLPQCHACAQSVHTLGATTECSNTPARQLTNWPTILESFKVLFASCFEDPITWWPWEPPVSHGNCRIYWNCECGAELFDDEPLHDNPPDPGTGLARLTGQAGFSESLVTMGIAVRRVVRRLIGWVIRSRHSKPPLSQCNSRLNTQQEAAAQLPKYLLVCINTKRHRARLVQIPVSTNSRDGNIFEKFRSHYFRFELYLKDLVGIKYEEIPPDEVKEYDYSPRPCPQKSLPPYGPVSKGTLLHNFEEPHMFTNCNGILPTIPKKLDPPLHSRPEYVDGWGLHVVEGLCVIRMIIAGGFLTVLSLILYGVLLAVWQSRQDAAATAALCAAVLTLLVMVVQFLQGVMQG
ncbi:hypothetical protein K440DRAFT_663839 [Wilcoxina mikolae CBS 423.85]|nr:hypothetical protein K440DRAFT_663839 [Wilcoxina mikolae CBS 423.85]